MTEKDASTHLEPASEDAEPQDAPSLVRASEVLPDDIPIIPLRIRPFFPGLPIPMAFEEPDDIATLKAALKTPVQVIGLVLLKDIDADADENNFHHMGVVAKILKVMYADENSAHVLINCMERFSVDRVFATKHGFAARVTYHYAKESSVNEELKAYAMAIISTLKELMQLSPIHSEAIKVFLSRSTLDDPGRLADFAVNLTSADREELQDVLETLDIRHRIDKSLILIKKELEISRLKQKITKQIEEKISKQQREFFLKEQLKAIKQELGIEKEGKAAEIERFQARIKNLKFNDEARKVVEEELDKLRILEPASPEYTVTRNYLDWLTILPWGRFSKDRFDLKRARRILDRDHYGLDDVKDRILEFIAVGQLKGDISGSILCLVGPPGVGKTSVGRSIADALNRTFFRFSLGGMRDEAEIKGHRRTYIGAMPGKFIQAMKSVGKANPVLMLDEVDKIGASFRGDPASALLEVLDPEQNNSFRDHYLDVPFDLSNVLFVATANQLDTIPPPLLDRMEIIRLSGYILEEKVQIAKRYLVPRAISSHGLGKHQFSITPAAMQELINGYAREAGVRNLEKQIRKIVRKAAMDIVSGETAKLNLKKGMLERILGRPSFETEKIEDGKPGLATGLAWTSMGGATLQIEATSIASKSRGFKQTGQLGKVMVESSEIAYSYVMANLENLHAHADTASDFFDQHFIHLHVPAGATPKDGPSAGITMATALLSLATQKAPRSRLAMTGELTLTGRVLPIGGVKEKLIAARRAGRTCLLFPEANRKDIDDLPDYLKSGLELHFAEHFMDVVRIAFP